jgi:hypothetical protein
MIESETTNKFKPFYHCFEKFKNSMNNIVDTNLKISCGELSEIKAPNEVICRMQDKYVAKIIVLDYVIEKNNSKERIVFDRVNKFLEEKI